MPAWPEARIRTADPRIAWQQEIDAALRLAGLGDLKQYGAELVAPDYWDLMTAQTGPPDDPPKTTFAKPSDERQIRDAGDYWLAGSRLEQAVGEHVARPSVLEAVPAD